MDQSNTPLPNSSVSGTLSTASGGTGTTPPVLTLSQRIQAKLKALLADVSTVTKDIWNDNKAIFIVLVPLIAVIYGRNFLMSLIVSQAKKTITNATQQDNKLAQQETKANTEANQLIQTAESLPSQEQPVTQDWYTKK